MKQLYVEIFSDVSENGICFVPLETAIVLFLHEYLEQPPVLVTLVLSSNLESCAHFKVQLPDLLFDILSEEDVESPGNLCKLPSLADNASCVAGLCSVLRQMVRIEDEKHPLLGFKQGCLYACAESSVWTKFCEVDIVQTVNDLFLGEDGVQSIPYNVARFEKHMEKPVKAHNIQKQKQDQARMEGHAVHSGLPDSRLDTIPDLEHVYVEGHKMSLADLALFPCFRLVFQLIENPFVRKLLPLSYKWYDLLMTDENVRRAMKLLPEIETTVPDVELSLPNVPDISLYKSEWRNSRGKKRLYTKQDNIDGSLEIIKEIGTGEVCSSERTFGYVMNFTWPTVPFGKSEFPEERFNRKAQQLENMAKAVLKIAKTGDRIVDFCSGSGYLGLILAYCLPDCTIILLENKEESLRRARRESVDSKLTNTIFCQGNIDYFRGDFDVGVSLHACGVATDLVMEICLEKKASFVCCPCCYGSIQPNHLLEYPRSLKFKESRLSIEDYLTLAHSSDQTHGENDRKTSQGKKCMTIIDTDRCLRAREMGYSVHLSTMEPPSCTPKNNLLVGIPQFGNSTISNSSIL